MSAMPERRIPAQSHWDRNDVLTIPEIQALSAVSHGLTAYMSAEVLGRGRETIATQLKAARYKLKAKTTTHAVAIALRRGII